MQDKYSEKKNEIQGIFVYMPYIHDITIM